MKINLSSLALRDIAWLCGSVLGLGILYGSLTTRLEAQEGKTKTLIELVPTLATKEDVLEVRKDIRAFARGSRLAELDASQASQDQRSRQTRRD